MEKRLKIIYRKNLKMSPGKIAAQCVHASAGLGHTDSSMSVIVLGVSDRVFENRKLLSKQNKLDDYVVIDAGFTEVIAGSETCAAYYEYV